MIKNCTVIIFIRVFSLSLTTSSVAGSHARLVFKNAITLIAKKCLY